MFSRLSDQNIEDPLIRNAMYRELLASDSSEWAEKSIGINEEFRPDIVSNVVYGTPECRWFVLLAAGLSDEIEALPVGKTLRFPPAYLIRQLIKKHGG